jgi:hypothetical protein
MVKYQKELPVKELSVKAPKELSAALGSWTTGFLLQLVLRVLDSRVPKLGFSVRWSQISGCREPFAVRRWGGCRAPRPATGFGTGTEPVGVAVAANGWRCSKVGGTFLLEFQMCLVGMLKLFFYKF